MQPVKTKKKLSRADRKQIEAAIARANRTDKKEKSAQDSISILFECFFDGFDHFVELFGVVAHGCQPVISASALPLLSIATSSEDGSCGMA